MILIKCKNRSSNVEELNINAYIESYYDKTSDTLDYSRFNKESNGINKMICIDPRLKSLEFFLVDSTEKSISYYKNYVEKKYSLQWQTKPLYDSLK